MKRIFALLLALLLLAVPFAAFADVIVEPENSFYKNHSDECKFIEGRTFVFNGENGSVNGCTSPGGVVHASYENGEQFYVDCIYTDKDGAVWGYNSNGEDWIPLAYAKVFYDYISFAQDRSGEFTETDKAFKELMEGDTAMLYAYPNGPAKYTLEGFSNDDFTPQYLYTDENGKQWAFIGYYRGRQNSWVCLDDPTNESLSTDIQPDLDTPYPVVPVNAGSSGQLYYVIGAVAAVAVITLAVLLICFKKKKKAPSAS